MKTPVYIFFCQMLFVTWEKFTTLQFPLDQAPRRRKSVTDDRASGSSPFFCDSCVLMTNPGRPVKLFFSSSSFLSWSTQNNNNNNSAVVQQSLKIKRENTLWIAIHNGRDWNSYCRLVHHKKRVRNVSKSLTDWVWTTPPTTLSVTFRSIRELRFFFFFYITAI